MQQFSVTQSLEQGRNYLDQSRYKEALELFQQIEKVDPYNPYLLSEIGLCFYLLADYQSSISFLNKALQIEPNSCLSLARRGISYQKLKAAEQAEVDFIRATTIQPQSHEDFKGRGLALMRLKKYEEALESYTEASKLCPSDHHIWCNRANALSSLKRYQEALDSLEEAVKLKPNYHYAWRERGILLRNLNLPEVALASYDKALELCHDDYSTWLHRGHVLQNLSRYSEALDSYKKALSLNPNEQVIKAAYNKAHERLVKIERGIEIKSASSTNLLKQIGDTFKLNFQYKEALAKYNEALKLDPEDSLTWSKRGDILVSLGRYREAISSFEQALLLDSEKQEMFYKQGKAFTFTGLPHRAIDCYKRAIELDPDYAQSWNGLGNALRSLQRYKEAVNAYEESIACTVKIKKLYYYCWRPLNNRGWAIFEWLGYSQAITSWNNALKNYLQPDKAIHKEGCGAINYSKGRVHYIYGSQQQNPLHYWREAKKSYEMALTFLGFETFPEQHLEVIQNLVTVCRSLGQSQAAGELLCTGSDLLERWLQGVKFNDKKIQLAQKFASFDQLRVDELADSKHSQAQIQALELAEKRKNVCLSWLRDGWTDESFGSPNYEEVQQLLDEQTVMVYWHISPAALTTFILKYNQDPVILPARAKSVNFAYPTTIRHLQDFEMWMDVWKSDYQKYRKQELGKVCHLKSRNYREEMTWFKKMPTRLKQLSEILNIQEIMSHIPGAKNLILVPHRDLHLLPIHACFPDDLNIVYLPSTQIGLNLKLLNTKKNSSILSINNPCSNLSFSLIESRLVNLLYPQTECFIAQATRKNLISALNKQPSCFHFAGHAYHNSNYPKKSALELADQEVLTLKDVFGIDLCGCHLVCLSACETGLTSKQNLLDEYVGLVSGFLAAGASRVISSLWAVHSEAAALLMIDFHIRRQAGKAAPTALIEAIRWLKSLTAKELSIWYEDILSRLADNEFSIRPFLETELDKLSLKEQDYKLYEHPYYWAAFTITGRND